MLGTTGRAFGHNCSCASTTITLLDRVNWLAISLLKFGKREHVSSIYSLHYNSLFRSLKYKWISWAFFLSNAISSRKPCKLHFILVEIYFRLYKAVHSYLSQLYTHCYLWALLFLCDLKLFSWNFDVTAMLRCHAYNMWNYIIRDKMILYYFCILLWAA